MKIVIGLFILCAMFPTSNFAYNELRLSGLVSPMISVSRGSEYLEIEQNSDQSFRVEIDDEPITSSDRKHLSIPLKNHKKRFTTISVISN